MAKRRVIAVFRRRKDKGLVGPPRNVVLIDAESGQELPIKDVQLNFPMTFHPTVLCEMLLSDVRIIDLEEGESES
jgi:hypothetical protein